MTRQRVLAATLVAVVGLSASRGVAQDKRAAGATDRAIAAVASLSWLRGSWTGEFMGGRFEAVYTDGAGGKLLSTSKSFEKDRVGFFEFEVFEADGDSVVLTPCPMGRPAESFKMIKSEERLALFENPNVEFPRSLRYERPEDGRLVIVLDGMRDGKPVRWTFDLKKS